MDCLFGGWKALFAPGFAVAGSDILVCMRGCGCGWSDRIKGALVLAAGAEFIARAVGVVAPIALEGWAELAVFGKASSDEAVGSGGVGPLSGVIASRETGKATLAASVNRAIHITAIELVWSPRRPGAPGDCLGAVMFATKGAATWEAAIAALDPAMRTLEGLSFQAPLIPEEIAAPRPGPASFRASVAGYCMVGLSNMCWCSRSSRLFGLSNSTSNARCSRTKKRRSNGAGSSTRKSS